MNLLPISPMLPANFLSPIFLFTSLQFFSVFTMIFVSLGIGIKSPFQRRKPKSTILLKKQVKFTDDLKCCPDILASAAEKGKGKDDPKVFVHVDPLQGRLGFFSC